MTFNDYFPRYIAGKQLQAKGTTVAAYNLLWRVHLSPYFGKLNIEDIKNSTCQHYVDSELLKGRAVKSLRDCITLLKNIIKQYCIVNDLPFMAPIIVWPTSSKIGAVKRDKFQEKDLEAIVKYCRDSQKHWHKLIALAALCGMRIGEAGGIKFGDFDFLEHTIHVQRTVGRIYNTDGHTELYINTPKTICSDRVIPVPVWLCQYYKQYMKLYNKSEDDFVTPGALDGTPFVEPRTLRVGFHSVCEKAGVEYKPFHCLRHTYASRLLLKGVDVRTAAELLGHSDVAMTLNIYGHSDNSAKQAAAKKIFL